MFFELPNTYALSSLIITGKRGRRLIQYLLCTFSALAEWKVDARNCLLFAKLATHVVCAQPVDGCRWGHDSVFIPYNTSVSEYDHAM